jgi:stage II sporulation protein D
MNLKSRWRFSVLLAGLLSVSSTGPEVSGAPWFGNQPKAQVVALQIPATIRVNLMHTRKRVTLICTGPCTYPNTKTGKPYQAKVRTRLSIQSGKRGLLINQKPVSGNFLVKPDSEDPISVNGRAYRGSIQLRSRGSGAIDVIEIVGLEQYLYGVLPREVGADWPIESLKAQAVISRTYVMANLSKSNAKGYDVTADVFSQVYGGLDDEKPTSNAAVDATRGEILIDSAGLPVLTFFHSSCGGQTETPNFVWKDIPKPPEYLDSVKDPFCKDDPFYEWNLEVTAETLARRLRRAGYRGGIPTKIVAGETSPSGRIYMFQVESSKGKSRVQGNAFRLAVGADALRSTLITAIKKRGKVFRFEGRGWGHGVGLCQWGARGRALEGQEYTLILESYYPHVQLVKAADAVTAAP